MGRLTSEARGPPVSSQIQRPQMHTTMPQLLPEGSVDQTQIPSIMWQDFTNRTISPEQKEIPLLHSTRKQGPQDVIRSYKNNSTSII